VALPTGPCPRPCTHQFIAGPSLDDEALQLAGINDFDAMCAACHGAPGQDPEVIGKGLNPPAPALKESVTHRTPAELFWVTKHVIEMTGVPHPTQIAMMTEIDLTSINRVTVS